MLILGIDPGTATIGYGLLESTKEQKPKLIDCGLIQTDKESDHGSRLSEIYRDTQKLLKKHKPDIVCFERLFFFVNAKTAMQVAQSIGVMMMAASKAKIPIKEYMPRQIKLQITGDGKSDKRKMQKVIYETFKIKAGKNQKTHFDNTADAIAVALCHIKMASEVV